MKLGLFLVALSSLCVGCSSGNASQGAAGTGGQAGAAGSAGTWASGGAQGGGGATGNTHYDLNVDFWAENFGEPLSRSWTIGVRDAADGKLVLFESMIDPLDQDKSQKSSRFQKSFAGLLQAGHDYRLGVAIIHPGACGGYGNEGAWYFELPAVGANVDLAQTLTWAEGADERGCELFYEPSGLAPGLYRNTQTILGYSQNLIEVMVSDTGRIRVTDAFVLCPESNMTWEWCDVSLPTTLSSCAGHSSPFPGSNQFHIGNHGDYASFDSVATIDVAESTIHVEGTTLAISPDTVCCTAPVQTTLERVGDVPADEVCP
jgi:hypothetical protein